MHLMWDGALTDIMNVMDPIVRLDPTFTISFWASMENVLIKSTKSLNHGNAVTFPPLPFFVSVNEGPIGSKIRSICEKFIDEQTEFVEKGTISSKKKDGGGIISFVKSFPVYFNSINELIMLVICKKS